MYLSSAITTRRNVLRRVVSPPIGQALSTDFLEDRIGALVVVDAHRGAVVVTEVKLSDVALQMRFADVMICSDQAALEDGEVAFNRVRRNRAASIFLGAVIHGLMRCELAVQFAICA